eukprot:1194646-Prorocentrum_minimum.AAC.8
MVHTVGVAELSFAQSTGGLTSAAEQSYGLPLEASPLVAWAGQHPLGGKASGEGARVAALLKETLPGFDFLGFWAMVRGSM